jgi:hypothetical protein
MKCLQKKFVIVGLFSVSARVMENDVGKAIRGQIMKSLLFQDKNVFNVIMRTTRKHCF